MQEYAYAAAEPRKQAAPKPQKVKIKHSNKTKVMICYALCWGLALALPMAGFLWVYPYKLVGTAPAIVENIVVAFPGLSGGLGSALRASALTEGMNSQALARALATRDLQWKMFVGGLSALLWGGSLLMQLGWRSLYTHPMGIARAARRAVRSYRFFLLGIALVNVAGGLMVYLLGMQFVSGRTLWDWLVYMAGFALNILAAFLCFRLAAPPAISGKHAFFKRL